MSLNGALAVASNTLQLYSTGIQIAGNNIANASTPGYIREKLSILPSPPYAQGPVLVGTGAQAGGVRQVFDRFLESRIHTANTSLASATIRLQAYNDLQSAMRELGDFDLSTSLNQFVQAVQNAANSPDDSAMRNIVVQQGQLFAQDVVDLRRRVNSVGDSYSNQMSLLTEEANALIAEIAALNPQIGRLEANGLGQSEAGALRVQRLNAVNRLSEILPVRIYEHSSGAIDVFTDSDFLILGGYSQQLEVVLAPTESGVSEINVQLSLTKARIGHNDGELGGLIESRDNIFNGFIQQLDLFVGTVIHEFNLQHSQGEGLIGYTDVRSSNFVNDTTAGLNAAGLPFSPQHGSFDILVQNSTTGVVERHTIPIQLDGTTPPTTLEDLRNMLNSLDNVQAEITPDRRLQIRTTSGYEVRFSQDTSGVLAALGVNTFFTGFQSDNIGVNSLVLSDQRYFASGLGGGPGDNTNALKLAQFVDVSQGVLNGLSIDQFYNSLVANVAQSAAAENALVEGSRNFRDALMIQREQRSGVSIDEEMITIMMLQRNYQAAARIITTVDQLLNTLLNI